MRPHILGEMQHGFLSESSLDDDDDDVRGIQESPAAQGYP